MSVFKDDLQRTTLLAPCGYWVVLRPNIGEPGWVVTVYNFATWKHRQTRFADEAAARGYFDQWTI